MNQTTLEIKNMTKNYKSETVLNELSFQLQQGEILSIVGPSGSGKTTLLRVLAGLEEPTNGSIFMYGEEITKQKANKRDISLVFQQPLLFPHMTVMENIVYGAKISKKYKKEKTDALLTAIGMGKYQDHFPSEISGGQQQRTALARAMATEPEVILFDEPFSSLDPSLRQDLRYWVRNFLVKQKTTAIFVTHDMEEAMIMGDKIAVFTEGQFQQIGKAKTLQESPANLLVASFMGGNLILSEEEYISLQEITLSPPTDRKADRIYEATLLHVTYQHARPIAHLHIHSLDEKVSLPLQHEDELQENVTIYIPDSEVRRFHEEGR
ncbi:sulfate transport system ATP-binding protein [Halobacillus dabanensis]|uniref:Carnitine transport ATP-binding protein OpuCA n=1 Tax=Halobacillus dabanensis TaxID=240302 RepID=A0A1I3YYR0_HALDA|nr:ABC transporter ATP-binding protein [Halobacillus dabanensis]SFK36955.1 sulfate transport system ATP-binding protein [Halobacillus dabanensis]